MNKTTAKSMLLTLIGALIVSGCANPNAKDDMASVSTPSSDMASSAPQSNLNVPATDEQSVKTPVVQAVLDHVYFAYDQSTLSDQARNTLATNAAVLQSLPELTIRIEGHCDDRGSDEYNLALGERRAQSVRTYLESLGIAPERLATISYGEEMPIAKENNEMAWAKNRRAEFKMLN